MRSTSDFILSGIVMSFAPQIFLCTFCSFIGSAVDSKDVAMASVSAHNAATSAECSNTILPSIGNILGMKFLIDGIPSETFVIGFCTTPN